MEKKTIKVSSHLAGCHHILKHRRAFICKNMDCGCMEIQKVCFFSWMWRQGGRMNIYCKAISLQRAELLRPHLHNYLARWPAQARGRGEKLNFLKSRVSILDLT